MSRYSGKQGSGASRWLHAQRRAEAEARQAEERTQDEARRTAYVEPPPLTDAEFAELIRAARIALGACPACTGYGHDAEFCPLLADDMAAVTN